MVSNCSERWVCPLCGLEGQTQEGREFDTNMAAHTRWIHPDGK